MRCEPEGCDMYNDCDINARCLLDDRTSRYRCVCNPGYDGDGKACVSRGKVNYILHKKVLEVVMFLSG